MHKHVFVLSLFIIFSCSTQTVGPNRQIANDISVDEILDQYYFLQVYGHTQMDQFDKIVKRGDPDYLQSAPYMELQIIRSKLEELEQLFKMNWTQVEAQSWEEERSFFNFKYNFMAPIFTAEEGYSSEKLNRKLIKNELRGFLVNKRFEDLRGEISKGAMDLKSYLEKENLIPEKFNSDDLKNHGPITNNGFEKERAHPLVQNNERFAPSVDKKGNIVGSEFPDKVWTITFDDGPHGTRSKRILKNLTDKKIKANFFQLTENAINLPGISHEIRNAGHMIACHSYNHKDLTKVNSVELEKQITTATKDLEDLQDVDIKFFRLPYGAGVSRPVIRQKIAANKLIHAFWTVDTLDWKAGSTAQEVVNRTLAQMKTRDSGMILFHDIQERTVEASSQIMDYLNKANRRVCTLEEIVNQMNKGVEVCPVKAPTTP